MVIFHLHLTLAPLCAAGKINPQLFHTRASVTSLRVNSPSLRLLLGVAQRDFIFFTHTFSSLFHLTRASVNALCLLSAPDNRELQGQDYSLVHLPTCAVFINLNFFLTFSSATPYFSSAALVPNALDA